MSPSPPLPPLSKHFYKVDQGSVVETDAILYERALCLQRLSFPVFHDRVRNFFLSNRSRGIPFVVSTLIFNSSMKIRLTFRPESRELKKRRRERRRGARLKVALSKICESVGNTDVPRIIR